jgi:hypothetical protein
MTCVHPLGAAVVTIGCLPIPARVGSKARV